MLLYKHYILIVISFFLLVLSLPSFAWKMEAGKLTLSASTGLSQLESHTFKQIYDSPPIVISLPTTAGGDTSSIRISNITTTGFRMSPVEPNSEDGPHAAMTVSYIAIEAGSHTFPDGEKIEAGSISTDSIQFNGNPNGRKAWETLNFTNPFSSPVLLASIQTINNEVNTTPSQASHPWMTVAIDDITNTQANIALERSEVYDRITGSNYQFDALSRHESIGYVVMDKNIRGNFRASGNLLINFETLYSQNSINGWSNGCDSINFAGSYSTTPIVIANQSTRDEDDGGWFRECSVSPSNIQLTIDEDDAQDKERSHTTEDASLLLFSDTFYYDSNAATSVNTSSSLMLESGTESISPSQFTTINFKQVYDFPPAVFILADDQNPEPSSARIRNITKQSFSVVPVEPDSRVADAIDQSSTIHYLAITKGEFKFPDGKKIEVGPVVPPNEIINFQSKLLSGDSWYSFNFATNFSNTPTFISQIQSMNSETAHTPGNPSQPWMTTAARNITSTGGDIALDRAETNTGNISAPEEISFLAIEPGIIGDFKDNTGSTILSEAQVTPDNVAGTRSCFSYNFLQHYLSPPLVIGSQMTWDGGDGGWLRRCSTSASQVNIKIEEDWAADTDNSHTTERAGFLAFSEPFYADFSLVANYQLEGPVWNTDPNQIIDSSNSGLNGQAYGDARVYPAKVCNGVLLDGTGDYIEIADDPILDISDELTVMAWVKASTFPASDLMTIVSKDTNFEFHIEPTGKIMWWWNNSSGVDRSFNSNTTSLTLGNWHHVAISYSKSAASQKIYIDGVVANSQTYANESLINNNLPLFIGTDYEYRPRDFNGSIDEVKIFRRALTANSIQKYAAESRPCSSCILDRFELSQPSTALACPDTRAEIDITARCVDGTVKTDYTGTVNLSAPSGGTFFDSSIGGNTLSSLSYSFSDQGNRKAYLYFDNEEDGIQVTANDTLAGISNTATNGTNFRAFGFRVTQQPSNFICSSNTNMTLQAYGKSNNGTAESCEVLTGFHGDKTLNTWFRATLDDDNTPDNLNITLNIAGTPITAQNNLNNNNLTLDFINGESSFDIGYDNAAQFIDINFDLDNTQYSQMSASTNSFVSYPDRFQITAKSNGSDITGNSSGSMTTHKAGQNFELGLTAQCSDGTTSTDFHPTQSATGIMAYLQRTGPTGGSSVDGEMPISIGTILTSKASASIAWEASDLSSSNFTNGEYSFSGANFSEVGLTKLFIEGRNYFGQNISQSSLNIGRFIPDYFTVTVYNGSLEPFCNIGSDPDFSYIGQPISYTPASAFAPASTPTLTIRAFNAANMNNKITQNYTEPGFLKLTTQNDNIGRTFPSEDTTNSGMDGVTKMTIISSKTRPLSFSSAESGAMEYSFLESDSFVYTRNANSLVAPFDTDIKIVISGIGDSDGVQSNIASYDIVPSAIKLHYGRWVLDGAFGPETQNLAIPMRIESWNGTNFSENTSDNCSTYAASDMTVTALLSGGSTSLTGNGALIFGKAPLSSQLSLSAPGADNTGNVKLEFDVDSWLRYDWDNNPVTVDTNPTSTASFGQYRGHDKIIYWREVSN